MQRHKNDPRPPHPHPQLPPGSLPPDSRHQTMIVSITRRCSSCDFDEGKDNNKGLQQQGLQMMNPFTSFRSAFDDFRKKFKHWTRTKWICKGEISISRRIWIYASTSAPSPWCYVNKQSIRIRKLFKDFVFLWSSQKGDGMNEINNWVGTWGVGIRDVVLMRHILEVAGCLKNEKGAFILLHFITHILFILNRKGETPRSDIQYHRRAREPFPYREYMLYFLVTSILLAAFFIFC